MNTACFFVATGHAQCAETSQWIRLENAKFSIAEPKIRIQVWDHRGVAVRFVIVVCKWIEKTSKF